MKIVIQRMWQCPAVRKPGTTRVESCTVGTLTVYKLMGKELRIVHRCYTIENGGESSPEANKDRRIMPDIYKLTLSPTKVPLPREYEGRGVLICKDGDFGEFAKRRIFIHAGNYPQDTEGCILLQSTYDTTENPGYGRGSMRAVKKLYDLIFENGIQSFGLYIKDETDVDPESFI